RTVQAAAPPRDTRGGRHLGPCISTNAHDLERKCGGRNRTKGFPTHCEWRLRYAQRLLFPKSRSSLLDEVTQFLHREPHQLVPLCGIGGGVLRGDRDVLDVSCIVHVGRGQLLVGDHTVHLHPGHPLTGTALVLDEVVGQVGDQDHSTTGSIGICGQQRQGLLRSGTHRLVTGLLHVPTPLRVGHERGRRSLLRSPLLQQAGQGSDGAGQENVHASGSPEDGPNIPSVPNPGRGAAPTPRWIGEEVPHIGTQVGCCPEAKDAPSPFGTKNRFNSARVAAASVWRIPAIPRPSAAWTLCSRSSMNTHSSGRRPKRSQ